MNNTCRTLEQQGVLTRPNAVGSSIVNMLTGVPLPAKQQPTESPGQLLTEDEVKSAERDHLEVMTLAGVPHSCSPIFPRWSGVGLGWMVVTVGGGEAGA